MNPKLLKDLEKPQYETLVNIGVLFRLDSLAGSEPDNESGHWASFYFDKYILTEPELKATIDQASDEEDSYDDLLNDPDFFLLDDEDDKVSLNNPKPADGSQDPLKGGTRKLNEIIVAYQPASTKSKTSGLTCFSVLNIKVYYYFENNSNRILRYALSINLDTKEAMARCYLSGGFEVPVNTKEVWKAISEALDKYENLQG